MTTAKDYQKDVELVGVRVRSIQAEADLISNDSAFNDYLEGGVTFIDRAQTSIGWRYENVGLGNDKHVTIVNAKFQVEALLGEDEEQIMNLEVVFEATYESSYALDDRLFKVMVKSLFPIHIHPFAREAIHNLTFRMGLHPIMLPQLGSSRLSKNKPNKEELK